MGGAIAPPAPPWLRYWLGGSYTFHGGTEKVHHLARLTNAGRPQNFEPPFIIRALVHEPANLVFIEDKRDILAIITDLRRKINVLIASLSLKVFMQSRFII